MGSNKIGRDVIKVKVSPTTFKLPKKTFRRRGKLVHRKAQTVSRVGYQYWKKDLGAPGKGPKVIPPLKAGELSKHLSKKYQGKPFFSCPTKTRRSAVRRSIRKAGYLATKGRLWAIVQLNKRINPNLSKKARRDFNWTVRNYGLKAGFPLGK